MLLNLSNHPYSKWSEKQKETARLQYGSVIDLSFPMVDPNGSTSDVKELALSFFNKITAILDECANEPYINALHIQGEFTFVYHLVALLKSSGVRCVASTSYRDIKQVGNKKMITFNFVQFREY